jgi:hypothetical protein
MHDFRPLNINQLDKFAQKSFFFINDIKLFILNLRKN